MIRVRCVECDETLRVADEHAGVRIRCKHCGAANQVPDRFDDEYGPVDYDAGVTRLPPKIKRPKKRQKPVPSSPSSPQSKPQSALVREITGTMDLMPRPIKMTLYGVAALVAGIVVAFIIALVVPQALMAVNAILFVAGFVLMLWSIFGLFYDATVAYGPTLIPGARLVRIVMYSIQWWDYAKIHYIRAGQCLLCFLGAMILSSIGQHASLARQSARSADSSRRTEPTGTYGYGRPAYPRQTSTQNTSRRPRPADTSTTNRSQPTTTANTQPPIQTTTRPTTQPQPPTAFNSSPTPVSRGGSAIPPATAPASPPPLGPPLPLFGSDGQFNTTAGSAPVQVYLGSTAGAPGDAATEVAVYLPRHTGGERLPCVLIPAEPPDALCGAAIGDPADHPECVRHAEAGFVVVLFSVAGSRPPWSEADPGQRVAAYEQFRKSQAGLADAQAALALARDRLPIVDPERLYTLGLRCGGTLALLLAARAPEIKACVAYKPIVDRAEWLTNEAPDSGMLGDAGELKTFLEQSSPLHQFQRIGCPILLMTSKEDPSKAWGMRHLFRHVGTGPRSRYQEMNYRPHTAASELPTFSADWLKRLEQ